MKYLISVCLISMSPLLAANDTAVATDSYRWLEQNDDQQTVDWLSQQDSLSENYFQQDSVREMVTNRLNALLEFDSIGAPHKLSDNYFALCRLKGKAQTGLYKQVSKGVWSPLIDPTTFCKEGTISLTGYTIHLGASLIAYGLSRGGSDWHEWRVRDLETGHDLPDVISGIKFTSPSWDDKGEWLYYFGFDNSSQEDAVTHAQHLYYHRIGTPSSQDKKLFTNRELGALYSKPLITEDGRYLLFIERKGYGNSNVILYTDLQDGTFNFSEIGSNSQALYTYFDTVDSRVYFITNENAPNGKIVSIDFSATAKNTVEHVPETQHLIEQACLAGNKIVVSYLKDACSKIHVFDEAGKLCHEIQGGGKTGKNLRLNGSNDDSEFFYSYTDFVNPTVVYRANAETGVSDVFIAPQICWNPENYQIKQIFYPGKDGTLIPMFIVHKKGIEMDGSHPTLLYGYGGFNITVSPGFDPKIVAWLDLGGVYAVANIRGGGEYGEAWHKAGMLRNKQTVFDDFIAAAEWLCEQGYTNPAKLAINGRSNGGLLVGACMVQRPDLFRAAIVSVGVLDMLRFHLFTVGWFWMEEYGSPDNPEDYKYLYAYSPYHQVKPGTAYPSTLVTTSDHDNRVVPLHSYKFAAALQEAQASDNPILLRVYKNSGHGAGRSVLQITQENADHLYFLIRELQIDLDSFDDF